MVVVAPKGVQLQWVAEMSERFGEEFVRVGPKVVDDICSRAKVSEKARPAQIAREEAAALHAAIQSAKIMAPPTTCLSPIGEELILAQPA